MLQNNILWLLTERKNVWESMALRTIKKINQILKLEELDFNSGATTIIM